MTPDTEGAGPLSKRIEVLLADVIGRGLRLPIVASIVAANRSCVAVCYEANEPIDVTMLAGHVARGGYALPAHAMLIDQAHQVVLAVLGADGHRVLFPEALL